MKRLPFAIALMALLAVIAAPPSVAQNVLQIGDALPLADRSMTSAAGDATSLGQVAGSQGTAVIFWSNTCPWTRRYDTRLNTLWQEFQGQDIGFVVINPNDPVSNPGDDLEAMQARGYDFPYLVDEGSATARAFGATRTPQVFVFDGNNALIYEGGFDDSPSDADAVTQHFLRDALNSSIAGQPVAVQNTSAFGCTIKFVD